MEVKAKVAACMAGVAVVAWVVAAMVTVAVADVETGAATECLVP